MDLLTVPDVCSGKVGLRVSAAGPITIRYLWDLLDCCAAKHGLGVSTNHSY
jgi:hypothetical protein